MEYIFSKVGGLLFVVVFFSLPILGVVQHKYYINIHFPILGVFDVKVCLLI